LLFPFLCAACTKGILCHHYYSTLPWNHSYDHYNKIRTSLDTALLMLPHRQYVNHPVQSNASLMPMMSVSSWTLLLTLYASTSISKPIQMSPMPTLTTTRPKPSLWMVRNRRIGCHYLRDIGSPPIITDTLTQLSDTLAFPCPTPKLSGNRSAIAF
jgi:hypothetical protein